MKTLATLALLVGGLSSLSACSMITSQQPSSTAATGEAWYAKTRVFIIPYSNAIYYCDGKSNVCKEAEMK